jgi:aminoglycoside phosphotransferase (APT) family kinase protein
MDMRDASAIPTTANVEPDDLAPRLERLLCESLARPVRISSICRRPGEFASRSAVEILELMFSDGEKLCLFLKHVGTDNSGHPDKALRTRELRVFDQLFQQHDLPVPRYFGSCWDDQLQRGELFLQYVSDWNLKYQSLEHWFTAARRLAQMQLYFNGRTDELTGSGFLLRLNTDYLRAWARRAIAAATDRSTELAAELKPVVENLSGAAELLARQPLTLVHNDLAPKNVLADRSTDPAQIFFVDWEMAGIGCGMLDLVHLKYGLKLADDQKMLDAYCGELAGTGLVPSRRDELRSLLAACELHQTIYRLAHIHAWNVATDTAGKWVADARQFLEAAR